MTPKEQSDFDTLRSALRDLAFGAGAMMQIPGRQDSALHRYAIEVKRVAEVALGHEVKVW